MNSVITELSAMWDGLKIVHENLDIAKVNHL